MKVYQLVLFTILVVALSFFSCFSGGDDDDDDGMPGGDEENVSTQCEDLKSVAYDTCDGFLDVDIEQFDAVCEKYGSQAVWLCFFACEESFTGTNCNEFEACLDECNNPEADDDDDIDDDDDNDDDADDDADDDTDDDADDDACEEAAVGIYDYCDDDLHESNRDNFVSICDDGVNPDFWDCIFSCTGGFFGNCEELGTCLDACEENADDDTDDDDDTDVPTNASTN